MRLDNKIMLCAGLFVILVLLFGCAKPPEKTWTINNLGKEFERQGII